MTGRDATHLGTERLSGWKEIASFLGRDERTAKRWEAQRGLPVRRPPGQARGGVYASRGELRAWLSGLDEGDVAGAGDPGEPADAPPASAPAPSRGRRLPWAGLGAGVAALAVVALGLTLGQAVVVRPPQFGAEPGAADASPHGRAVELYRQGQYLWSRRTPASLQQAVDRFTQAIVHDPNYAEAYMGLANSYNLLREFSVMPSSEAYPRARAAAERAVALNPHLADAHAALGFTSFWWEWDREKAWREFREAIRLDPRAATPHHWYATALLATGDYAGALTEIEQAQALDPRSSAILADKGLILWRLGRGSEAERLWTQLAEADPRLSSPWRYLGAFYLDGGRYLEGLQALRRAAEIRDDPAALQSVEAGEAGLRTAGAHGMRVAMLRVDAQSLSRGGVGGGDVALAQSYALAGDSASAVNRLTTALDRHDPDLPGINDVPELRPLRGDPRLHDRLVRARLVSP